MMMMMMWVLYIRTAGWSASSGRPGEEQARQRSANATRSEIADFFFESLSFGFRIYQPQCRCHRQCFVSINKASISLLTASRFAFAQGENSRSATLATQPASSLTSHCLLPLVLLGLHSAQREIY